ncbi:SH3 domain-containing protein [Rhodobacterales bacterium HKCCSP123]|nr:SH3 domain-containing protein [Rhodobacterales bacterium HKCCSP123]
MLRLTLMLSAAIYAGLVIYSDGVPPEDGGRVDVARAAPVSEPARVARAAAPSDRLATADGRVLTISAIIDPVALDDGQVAVHRISTPGAETVTASASVSGPARQPDPPRAEVTGASVNLRAGPSTDDAVLDALERGEQVELLASLDNGWAQIRTVDTGIEGYMADRFLAPVN